MTGQADTFGQWLYERLHPDDTPWVELSGNIQAYWDHQADAICQVFARTPDWLKKNMSESDLAKMRKSAASMLYAVQLRQIFGLPTADPEDPEEITIETEEQ